MLLLLLIFGFIAFGVFGIIVLFRLESAQKKAEKNADALLDAAFDGSPDVTYQTNLRSLKFDTVVLGAKSRGYKLVHQGGSENSKTLIFEKVTSPAALPAKSATQGP